VSRSFRQVAIAAAVIVTAAALHLAIPPAATARRWTLITAYVGLGLLATTLLIGPLYVFRGRRPPVSIGWRRDLGIWGGLVSLAHVVVGFRVHFRGQILRYFLYGPERGDGFPVRLDGVGWANHTGLLASLVLVLLVALSNDLALRRLGAARWKFLQRWNYAAFSLVGLHGAMYQVMVRRALPAVVLLGVTVAVTVGVQLAGVRARRRASRAGRAGDPVPS
jgi:DMSO/TMAO reductase YedYZ heme-binding membrane subunit